MTEIITSGANPKIKWVKSLRKNSTRRDEGVFLVEGAKEIAYALDGGYHPRCMFICPDLFAEDVGPQTLDLKDIYSVTREVFGKIAYRENSDGLLAVFESKQQTLDTITFGENPLFVVLESVEKPGNLGAVLRTADGAGVDAVVVCDPKCDVFNPNVIRSSVGTALTKQVVTCSSQEAYDFLEKHEITTYGALLSDKAKPYDQANFTTPTALVLGTEHEGLSKFWQSRAQPIMIPMLGSNDSLNVSNAAAVLTYEAVRQRYANTNLA